MLRNLEVPLVGAAANAKAPNYLRVVMDFTSPTWNTNGLHLVFAVTGLCRLRLWTLMPIEPTRAGPWEAPYAEFSLGTVNSPTLVTRAPYIVGQGYTGVGTFGSGKQLTFAAGKLINWRVDASNREEYLREVLLNDVSLYATLTHGPLVSGRMEWHCVWEPMTPGATVTAGDGSAPS